MTVAIVTALLVIAGMLGLVAWCVHGRVDASERANASDVLRITAESNLERAQFELEVTNRALRAANARGRLLEEAVNAHLADSPNPDLARNDVMSRTMRAYAAWAREDSLPAQPDRAMPDERAAHEAGPVVSPRDT